MLDAYFFVLFINLLGFNESKSQHDENQQIKPGVKVCGSDFEWFHWSGCEMLLVVWDLSSNIMTYGLQEKATNF